MSVHVRFNDNLLFADDINLIDQNCNSLQQAINNLLYVAKFFQIQSHPMPYRLGYLFFVLTISCRCFRCEDRFRILFLMRSELFDTTISLVAKAASLDKIKSPSLIPHFRRHFKISSQSTISTFSEENRTLSKKKYTFSYQKLFFVKPKPFSIFNNRTL